MNGSKLKRLNSQSLSLGEKRKLFKLLNNNTEKKTRCVFYR